MRDHAPRKVLAEINPDYGDFAIKFRGHAVLLYLRCPGQLASLAGLEHGRTIPLADSGRCRRLCDRGHTTQRRSVISFSPAHGLGRVGRDDSYHATTFCCRTGRRGGVAARGTRATGGRACDRVSWCWVAGRRRRLDGRLSPRSQGSRVFRGEQHRDRMVYCRDWQPIWSATGWR